MMENKKLLDTKNPLKIKKFIQAEYEVPLEKRIALELFKKGIGEGDLNNIGLEDTQRINVQGALRDLHIKFEGGA